MEEIAFSDWSHRLDITGSSHWLPAYGYHDTLQGHDSDGNDGAAVLIAGQPQQFLFLETIVEETSDDLRSESDKSGQAGWLDSDSDTGSVIHVQSNAECCDDDPHDWSGSERDFAVPKKRRRRTDDDEDDDREEIYSLSSRSSSLLQFECLEKHCEDVFRTSATSDPFQDQASPRVDSSFSFDSLESNRWRFSASPDSLDGRSSTSSSSDDVSSDDTLHHSSWSSRDSFRSQNSRIRSYRSFDSLNLLQQQKQQLSLVELSQSLNNDEFVLTHEGFDKSFVSATADLSQVGGETHVTAASPTLVNEDVADCGKEEPVIRTQPQRSAENLSEDSGFGDHVPKLSTVHGKIRNATIIEDEDAYSSSYYSDYSAGSASGDSEEGSENGSRTSGTSSKLLKLVENLKFMEVRGWDIEESKYNNSCWQSAPNLPTLHTRRRAEGEAPASSQAASRSGASQDRLNSLPGSIVLCFDTSCVRQEVQLDDTFKPFNMANRLPVVSTPNLVYNSEQDNDDQHEQLHSLVRVPLKHFSIDEDEYDKEAMSKSMTPLPTSGSTKGVHFCPVVSEVSWRESYSEEEPDDVTCEHDFEDDADEGVRDYDEDDEDEDGDDDDDDDEEEEEDSESEGEAVLLTDTETSHFASLVNELQIGFPSPIQREREVHQEEAVAVITLASPPTPTDHVGPSEASLWPNEAAVATAPVMEVHVRPSESAACGQTSPVSKKSTGRFGGFFQRFSFRRRSNEAKKDKKLDSAPSKTKSKNVARKPDVEYEDVTIIPLHPPPSETTKPDVVISAKPPLPPLPPRVVGASVKAPASRRGLQQSQGQRPTPVSSSMSGLVNAAQTIDPTTGGAKQHPTGLLETDLDTDITVSAQRPPLPNVVPKKARSLLNLGGMSHLNGGHLQNSAMLKPPSGGGVAAGHRPHHGTPADYRAKSMEFLLDKENQAAVQPPENELQKGGAGERVMSEHQLRVQRSLLKLNVPDWYKNSTVAGRPEGFLLKREQQQTQHQGWPGLGSKTTSLSSLGSSQSAAARSPTGHLLSPSPTPSPHVFTRWSTSRLNSAATSTSTSPCGSTRSSFNYRQPYLGWRSQERLSRPRTPAERLAAGIPQQQPSPTRQQVPNLSEVRTSIKEVTSAIVHYVSGVRDGSGGDLSHNDESPSNRSPRWERESLSPRGEWGSISRSSSPRGSGRLCWLESSFVGSRPLDSPETPLTLPTTHVNKTLKALDNDISGPARITTGGDLYLDFNNTKPPHQHHNAHHVNGEYLLT